MKRRHWLIAAGVSVLLIVALLPLFTAGSPDGSEPDCSRVETLEAQADAKETLMWEASDDYQEAVAARDTDRADKALEAFWMLHTDMNRLRGAKTELSRYCP